MSDNDIELGIQERPRAHSFSECTPVLNISLNTIPPSLVRRHSFSSLKPDFTGVFDKLVDIVDKSGYNTPRMTFPRMETMRFEFQNPLERVPSFLLETEEHDKKDCSRVINRFIFNAFENEDGKVTYLQAAFIVLHSLFEVYRAVISSFLTVFVPQRCPDGHICSLYDNVVPRDQLETIAIGFNAFMAAYFCMLFLVEATRERRIQAYLAISKEAPTSKKHLIDLMCNMDHEERTELLRINNSYRLTGIYMMVFFFVNSGLSWAVVYKNYLDNSTFITFTTNALFMINKLYGVLKITSSGEYNIYSAYLNDNLVYNEGTNGSLRNPPFTKTIGNNSVDNSRENSSKSFVEDLESRLSTFGVIQESDSGKE